jgi:NAD(P)-dependent dehydrogenase (short-subunit alcohol dehydrogenase family)
MKRDVLTMNHKKSVLVTGAASGIGRCIVEYLHRRGDHVFACDVNEQGLANLQRLEGVTPIKMDVTKLDDIHRAVQFIRDEANHLTGLVNNAGIGIGGPLVELPEEYLYRQFEVNVFGVVKVTKAFFPLLLQNRGRIVIMGSISGFFTAPFVGPYSMSKRAMEGYADALRRELDPLGIKVSIVEPGNVKTPIWEKAEALVREIEPCFSSLFHDRAIRIVEMGIRKARAKGLEPEAIAKKVYRALHDEHPKARYPINRNPLMFYLVKYLPGSVIDSIFQRI